jgi:hypothetical protein
MTQKIFHIPNVPKGDTPCKSFPFEYGLLMVYFVKNVNIRDKHIFFSRGGA